MDTTMESESVKEVVETEPVTDGNTWTGGTKPLHRFLKGEPKIIGIVLLSIGLCLFMFAFPSKRMESSSDSYTPFWLGILYSICGILYILSERQVNKKIVTASFALSIISILGTIVGSVLFVKTLLLQTQMHNYFHDDEHHDDEQLYISLEAVFLFHSLVAGVILIVMSVFARLSLRSSHTQMLVVMRYPASTE